MKRPKCKYVQGLNVITQKNPQLTKDVKITPPPPHKKTQTKQETVKIQTRKNSLKDKKGNVGWRDG